MTHTVQDFYKNDGEYGWCPFCGDPCLGPACPIAVSVKRNEIDDETCHCSIAVIPELLGNIHHNLHGIRFYQHKTYNAIEEIKDGE